jgi:hypothetical protein
MANESARVSAPTTAARLGTMGMFDMRFNECDSRTSGRGSGNSEDDDGRKKETETIDYRRC